VALLRLPGLPDAGAGGRAAALPGLALDLGIGVGLQLGQVVPRPAGRVEAAAAGADRPLDLALVRRRIGRAGIDVEADRGGVALVGGVEGAPAAGAAADRGLGVVDPDHRRDAAEALEGAVMAGQPRQLVLPVGPDDGLAAGVGQQQVEGLQRLPFAGDDDVRVHGAQSAWAWAPGGVSTPRRARRGGGG
jgi:hypothetical protein